MDGRPSHKHAGKIDDHLGLFHAFRFQKMGHMIMGEACGAIDFHKSVSLKIPNGPEPT